MTDFRTKIPKITWGAAFANTLSFGYLLDAIIAGSEPRDGSESVQGVSGVEDSWSVGTDYLLEADARWIPQANTASPVATGWDGATGWRAFLESARDKNVFRFYPDKDGGTYLTCYLVEPMRGQGEPETDGTRKIRFRMRNASSAFDGY